MAIDKLYFYSKSRDLPPGQGVNEWVSDPCGYATLANFVGWRKVLSNFHLYPFVYEGNTYPTIEHVFQAKKIALVDPNAAFFFTLESGHAIGQGNGEVARKHRKLVRLNDEHLRQWDAIKETVMKNAAIEKYRACEEARQVLRATGNAQLWHVVPRGRPVRFHHLEEIREMLL